MTFPANPWPALRTAARNAAEGAAKRKAKRGRAVNPKAMPPLPEGANHWSRSTKRTGHGRPRSALNEGFNSPDVERGPEGVVLK